jgi:putative ABC transport system permease protein
VDRAGVEIGEQIRFGLDVVGAEEWVSLPFVICGVYDYFPTVYPGERMVIVGNMAYLVNQIGGIGHYHAWLRTDPDARSTEIVDLVQRSLPIDVPTVQNARQLVLEKERLPERVGFFGTLSAGFVGVGGLAIVSYSLFAFLSLQRRSIEIGVLHAIGLTRASVARSLIYEQSVMLISAVLGAVGLGLLTAYRFVPLVEVGQTQREQVPPYIHHMVWSDLALMMAIVACVLVMAMAIVGYVVVRQRIGETLKLADL